ncbi:MAG: hypothetical protein KDG54_21195, partial [Geminicoccaceae bacterium]|nr:hypothetical protein [Geminicoccaceae bacterium]
SSVVKANDIAATRQVHKVDDLDALIVRLETAGTTFVSPGVVRLEDGQGAASVRDPDGHMVVLVG